MSSGTADGHTTAPPTRSELEARAAGDDREALQARIALTRQLLLRDAPRASQLAAESIALARRLEDPRGEAEALLVRSMATSYRSDYARAIPEAEAAIAAFESLNDPSGATKGRQVRAVGLSRLERFDEALAAFLEIRRAFEQLGDDRSLAITLNNTSNVHKQQGDLERALELRQQAATILDELGEQQQRATILANIGEIHIRQGNLDAALSSLQTALALLQEHDGPGTAIAHALSDLGRVFYELGDLKAAADHLERAITILERTGYQEGLAYTQIELGVVLMARGEFESAEQTLLEALGRASSHRIIRYEREAHRRLSELYEQQGEPTRALEHSRLFAELNEQLFDETRAKQMAQMEARFELESKEQQAEIYRLRYVELQQQTEERLHAERALIEAQRLESLGVMAGGVAHDFNNLLVGMIGQTSLALHLLAEGDPARTAVSKAAAAAERAAELAHQMLAYAGRTSLERSHCRLDQVVRDALPLLEVSAGQQVSLRPVLAEASPPLLADASQIGQVLLNLVLNSSEAGARNVHIEVGSYELAENDEGWDAYTGSPPAVGSCASLVVRDDGAGIAADDLSRLFDPFFTTKETGSGLGLAAVIGIVRGHHGGLKVESRQGEGTRMTLLFPAESTAATPPQEPIAAGHGIAN